eukprot:CAMPEP_0169159626 /NCGR_PEP_ID=MMETSP1015-20121227/55936_1 /TAXON_ID=342587 /ORGANISM="Karlodinium micrum, Strain CCMP2283" /LENGTH=115 /DNA_ID=CAMNT_0009231077 /DNA_START=210 /DNA_END=558 /DNA_ORIENTATION=+
MSDNATVRPMIRGLAKSLSYNFAPTTLTLSKQRAQEAHAATFQALLNSTIQALPSSLCLSPRNTRGKLVWRNPATRACPHSRTPEECLEYSCANPPTEQQCPMAFPADMNSLGDP